jgi:putative ABC transport system substrate-binding protein
MRRREFLGVLGGAAAVWPFGVRAQQPERVRRIGHLRATPPPERELQAFLQGLAEQGYVQGHNFVLVPQWGDGNLSRVSELAVMLVNGGIDVIVTESTFVTRVAAAVTATIPIIMVSSADPFVGGLVKNLSRPGGNVTGFANQAIDITGKVFETLMQMVTGARRLAIVSPRSQWSLFASVQEQAAKALGIELTYIDLTAAEAADVAMRQVVTVGIKGAMLRGSPFFSSAQRKMIVDSAAEHRLAVMYERRDFVEQGGLASYAADVRDQYRRAGDYIAKILAGVQPGDLPIQQPVKFEFVINLKTAKALGLDIPPSLLARADEVIE